MAYGASSNLPFESASKLGHISIVNDPFIKEMVRSFREIKRDPAEKPANGFEIVDADAEPLDFVVAVDGSMSTIPNALAPQKLLSYVKIAALNVSLKELARVQAPVVNPESVQRILSNYADTESTVLPLSNVRSPGRTLSQTIRHALQATFDKFQGGALYETLEYLVSYGWDDAAEPWRAGSPRRPYFFCPFCENRVDFPRFQRSFGCEQCKADLTLVDYLGLMMDVNEESNDSAIAFNLMGVLEHLLVFTFLKQLVEKGSGFHDRVLLIKDGPLMLRGQYSRLIDPMRGYLRHLNDRRVPFYLVGVEKDGAFAQHIAQMDDWFKGENAVFTPDNRYILDRIKHAGASATRYGEKVLYGAKVYVRTDDRNVLMLNIPNRRNGWDSYDENPKTADLIGLGRVLSTLRKLVSRQFQHALLPIVAINRLASMSYYPSNNILERFTEQQMAKTAARA